MSGDEEKKKTKKETSFTHMYDIVDRNESPRRSAITDALRREDEELANEAERLRLEQLISERRIKLQETRNASSPAGAGGGGSSTIVSSLMAMLISQGMSPAQVNEYVKALDNESILRLSMIGSQNMNSLLPISLMMAGGSKQGSSLNDALTVTKQIIDMTKTAGGSWENTQGAMVQKLVTETIPNMQLQLVQASTKAYEFQIASLSKKVEDLEATDPLSYVVKTYQAIKDLGMGNAGDIETQRLLLEDKRAERELKARSDDSRETLGMVKDMLDGRVGDLLEKVGGGVVSKMGGGGAAPQAPKERPQPTGTSSPIMVQCGKCGGTFKASSSADTVTCPHCSTVLPLERQQPEAPREAALPRVPQVGEGRGEFSPRWSGPPEKE